MTQSDPKGTKWRWPKKRNFICFLGLHKLEFHSIVREGNILTYSRCLRDCSAQGHWRLVKSEPLDE